MATDIGIVSLAHNYIELPTSGFYDCEQIKPSILLVSLAMVTHHFVFMIVLSFHGCVCVPGIIKHTRSWTNNT